MCKYNTPLPILVDMPNLIWSLNDVGINMEDLQNWGALKLHSLGMGGVAFLQDTRLSPICVTTSKLVPVVLYQRVCA